MCAASILEQADAKSRIDNFEIKDHMLHLIPLSNEEGGSIKSTMALSMSQKRKLLSSTDPPGKRTLIVSRAWIKDVQNETADWDRHEPKVIEPRHGGDREKLAQEISEEIQHISGNVVRLKVVNPVDKDELNSYDRLINPSDQLPLTDYNRNLVDVLLGGRHDKLKNLDKEVLDRIYVTMRARGVKNLHNLTCDTIDKLQDQEADIFIGLLPISEKMGMMGDPRRTATLVSCARNLFILCGSRRDIAKARGLAPEFAALPTHFGPNQTLKWNVPKENWQVPGQEYHTPSFAKTTRSLPYA
ncbi:hypothetical protein LTR05_001427 [Lithohypha guttulata]|uniref:Uncharacterized protein n=1 Tax=Lithohypha guttulata TaxID=1690604 RepID=A0AAN7YLE3_9EURO|nr:hypothetical protein LTR05_001427 [Lithohypha guttulata]